MIYLVLYILYIFDLLAEHPMPDWVNDPEKKEVPLEDISPTSTSVLSSAPTVSTPASTSTRRGRRSKRARIEADSTEQSQKTLVENSAESTIEQIVTGEEEEGEYSNLSNNSKGDETLPVGKSLSCMSITSAN